MALKFNCFGQFWVKKQDTNGNGYTTLQSYWYLLRYHIGCTTQVSTYLLVNTYISYIGMQEGTYGRPVQRAPHRKSWIMRFFLRFAAILRLDWTIFADSHPLYRERNFMLRQDAVNNIVPTYLLNNIVPTRTYLYLPTYLPIF